MKRKFFIFIFLAFFALSGCNKTSTTEITEVKVYDGREEQNEVSTLNTKKGIDELQTLLDEQKWRLPNGPNASTDYIGVDYNFMWNGQKFDVLLNEQDNSIFVYRNSPDTELKRAYFHNEQAEEFFELITGKSLTEG
ncbi:hypothetical protein [Rossellomorea aquimaris]|uniref:Lipoprotein n=1 Tax=Rossellomorea aquimaris TaxID=189382 RepID=A0A5D4TI45_9BACI|nr:hypothetical protein [Rossellomorea aquimaris]TYS75470.1 hypothetical protein FZC80_16880 [Rossellomorea aquimaris]